MAATDNNTPQTDEAAAKAEQARKTKAKIRTIRIWFWVIAGLFAAFFFLSQCAMSKTQMKEKVVASCVQNVPFTDKWQQDLQAKGLAEHSDDLIQDYCVCMWDQPLNKLSEKQLKEFGKLAPQQQLDLLGGAAAFEARDKQCVAALKLN